MTGLIAIIVDRLFADDVVIQVPGMRVLSKADAVGMFTTGRMKFDRYETSETTFRVYGETAIVTGRRPRRCQAMFCAQASLSTQRPIGTTSPVSSASGMNCPGDTVPRSGWFQRNSASTPVIWPLAMSTFG